MTDTFDLQIDSIAAGGDGVGRREGMVVFVPRTAPGDRVRVRAEQRDRLMRGSALELLEASSARVEPPCDHYVRDHCGGCQLQHLEYESQLEAKRGIIQDSLARIGRVQVERPVVEPSERPWRYRRKLTLALRRRGDRWIAGLYRYDAPEVFELRDCLITHEEVLGAWSQVMASQELFPRGADQLRGAIRLLPAGFSLTMEGGRDWPSHQQLFAAIPPLSELWWKPEGKSRRRLAARTDREEAGASFVQVNPGVAARLRECVVSLATARMPRSAVDAYSGTGDIAVALADRGIRVTAIERDRDAARVSSTRLPPGSRAIAAAVEDALPRALPADLIVLNPPRAGLDARVTATLQTRVPKPAALIYVSCDPATLARDLRRMDAFRITSVRGFDMFPQTAHVETVCELVPAA